MATNKNEQPDFKRSRIPKGFGVISALPNSRHERVNDNPLLPADEARFLVVGPSGCGKSTWAYNMAMREGWLTNDQVIFMCQSLNDQPFYRNLQEKVEENGIDGVYFYEELVPLDQLQEECGLANDVRTTLIIDDFSEKKHLQSPELWSYFYRSRHKGLTNVILLTHELINIPTRLRENCSHLVLFPGTLSDRRRQALVHAWCLSDCDKERWFRVCARYMMGADAVQARRYLYIEKNGNPATKVRLTLALNRHNQPQYIDLRQPTLEV